ncbi:MAG: T9SS type A sorting domain-containing protein [Flavobacteriales bacterium]|nr:T9SS type A sorting domain-containing protein [Flavobacteriales bacterium]
MKHYFILVFFSAALLFSLKAQTPTWSENIACIMYTNCTRCHNPGGVGLFSLVDYADAYAARFIVRDAVLNKVMPPWPPDPTYQTYAHERLLTQQEIDLIVNWVNGGAPEGPPSVAPTPPVYTSASELSQIDWSGVIPTYTNGATQDDYRCFVIPTGLSTDKFVKSIEILPGNRSIVHHVLVFADTSSQVLTLDANDPGPGYTSFGGTGSNTSKLIAAWVPGSEYITYPAGMGVKLRANSYIIMQIHYPAGTQGQIDSTRINIEYAPASGREVSLDPVLNHITNISPPLIIPPNTVKSFVEEYTIPSVTPFSDFFTVLSVAPHMHKVGTSIKCYAVLPSNDTIPLIHIPKWDFKWQGQYNFRQPKVFPEGTKLRAEAVYDNTSNNPNAPNPNNWVFAGEATNEEMMMVYFAYLYAFPGDENIIVDTTTVKPTYNNCKFVGLEDWGIKEASIQLYPNPTDGFSMLRFEAEKSNDLEIKICDMQGKVVYQYHTFVHSGVFTYPVEVNAIPAGQYFVVLGWGKEKYTRPLIVVKN